MPNSTKAKLIHMLVPLLEITPAYFLLEEVSLYYLKRDLGHYKFYPP
jgi:hypothetical protein